MSKRHDLDEGLAFDVHKDSVSRPLPQNDFDRDEGWITLIFTAAFVIASIVSGYATFTGIRLFLNDAGDVGLLVNGTSVLLTIGVVTMLAVGWSAICRYGPEARSPSLKGMMVGLGLFLFTITFCVSSLSNLTALVGPAAKVMDWRETLTQNRVAVNALGNRSLGVLQLRPGWVAERDKACRLAKGEREKGLVSSLGGGTGPVAAAFIGVCEQTSAFVASIDNAVEKTNLAVADSQEALREMRKAIRDRSAGVVEREDRYLDAGDLLNVSVQSILAADLSQVLEAGAAQVGQSVALLKAGSSFTPQQVEMVSGLRESLQGLLTSTSLVSAQLRAKTPPEYRPVAPLGFIAAIERYWTHFIPAFAAAIGIDCFQIWALGFLLVSKAGKSRHRLRGDFEAFLQTDAFTPLAAIRPDDEAAKRKNRWFLRRRGSSNISQ